jgi:hypothetical protein
MKADSGGKSALTKCYRRAAGAKNQGAWPFD